MTQQHANSDLVGFLRTRLNNEPGDMVNLVALRDTLVSAIPALDTHLPLDLLCQAARQCRAGKVVQVGDTAFLYRQTPRTHPNATEAIRQRLTARWHPGDIFTRRHLQQAIHSPGIGGPQITEAIAVLLADGTINETTYRDAAGRNRICYQVRGQDTVAAWE